MRAFYRAIAWALVAAIALCGCESASAQTRAATNAASRGATSTARAYACRPAVTSVTASSGTEVGGTTVTVNGTCLAGATAVTFGGVAGTSLGSVTPTSLSIVTPALTGGVVFDGRATAALSSTASQNNVTVAVTNATGTGSRAAGFQYTSELKRIAGSLYSNEYRANDPAIVIETGVKTWPDYNGNGAAAQSTTTKQPAFQATGWNGGPCITPDGSDDFLQVALSATIPNGNRPYVLVAARRVAGTALATTFVITDGARPNYLAIRSYDTGNFAVPLNSGTQSQTVSLGAVNTNKHLFEGGFRTSGTNAVVLDGSGSNSTVTSVLSGGAMDQMFIGAWASGSQLANVDIVAVLVLSNEPSSQNLTDLRAAIKASTWIGYTSNSLGLP